MGTEIGEVTVRVPRDRTGTFEPQIVPKHQRRLDGFDQNVLSLYAKGMTTGDIANHLAEIYGDEVSRDLVSTVTDRIVEEMAEWQSRPLEPVSPVLLIDAIMLKIRSGTVGHRPVYGRSASMWTGTATCSACGSGRRAEEERRTSGSLETQGLWDLRTESQRR